MTHEALSAAEPKMARALEAMERDFAGIRTGRASTALVERIMVDYYGTPTPLQQIAGISTPDPHLIVIQPWDRSVLSAIDKAITRSDIGLVPNVDGTVVRLNVPPLTEERRKEMVKQVRRRAEEARVEIRNHRREAADHLKKALRDGDLSEDEERRELDNLQRLTDRHVEAVDTRAERKEAEVMEVLGAPCASARDTSRSSWMATAGGRLPGACRASRATSRASRPSGRSSRPPRTAISRSSRCTSSARRTGAGPTRRLPACSA
jgi:ribosome recycling factor